MPNKILRELRKSSEYKVVSTWVLLTSLAFHTFILKEQQDRAYSITIILYLLYLIPRKNRERKIFKDALIGILVSATALIVKLDVATEILMDYVYILLALGIMYRTSELIRNSIANSPEKTPI